MRNLHSEVLTLDMVLVLLLLQCDFQVVYASGIQGKAGLEPENLSEDLEPLFESIIRCIPEPLVDKDSPLQMLVRCSPLVQPTKACHILPWTCLPATPNRRSSKLTAENDRFLKGAC